MFTKQIYIRLVGLPGLWYVNLAVLVYLPLTQRGSPPIESERKNISTWYNFLNSWSNHAKLSDFDHYIAVLWIWKLERKLSLRCWKTWLWIFALYKSNFFFFMLSPYSAGSWVSELSESAASDLPPSLWLGCIKGSIGERSDECVCLLFPKSDNALRIVVTIDYCDSLWYRIDICQNNKMLHLKKLGWSNWYLYIYRSLTSRLWPHN